MARDALSAHKRDELGFTEGAEANPVLAAGASAAAFGVGAALPTVAAFLRRNGRSSEPCRPRRSSSSPCSAPSAPGSAALRRSNRRSGWPSGALSPWS